MVLLWRGGYVEHFGTELSRQYGRRTAECLRERTAPPLAFTPRHRRDLVVVRPDPVVSTPLERFSVARATAGRPELLDRTTSWTSRGERKETWSKREKEKRSERGREAVEGKERKRRLEEGQRWLAGALAVLYRGRSYNQGERRKQEREREMGVNVAAT